MNKKPKITLSSLDADRLHALLDSPSFSHFPGKEALEAELLRADVVDPQKIPPNIVTMNSTVRFKVSDSDQEFTLRLVYPKDAVGSADVISVLAPVGSALLGIAQGSEIEWPKPGGGTLRVQIVEVVDQPERAKQFHR